MDIGCTLVHPLCVYIRPARIEALVSRELTDSERLAIKKSLVLVRNLDAFLLVILSTQITSFLLAHLFTAP